MPHPEFMPDDFFEVAARVNKKTPNPINLVSAAEEAVEVPNFDFNPSRMKSELIPYTNNDAGRGIEIREKISALLSGTNGFGEINFQNLTLAPSITSASINVILALTANNVKKISLATPCYYATKFQIEKLGLEVELLPTYSMSGFSIEPSLNKSDSQVLWVTNPIISLARDFEFGWIRSWLDRKTIHKKRFLVIDEAVDCKSPKQFDLEGFSQNGIEIIRLRSFFKQVSINGQRLAFIVSAQNMGIELSRETWISHGGIDQFSMSTVDWVMNHQTEYKRLLSMMLERCCIRNYKLNRLLSGSELAIPDYDNGYITSISVDMRLWRSYLESGHVAARQNLIEAFTNLGLLPVRHHINMDL